VTPGQHDYGTSGDGDTQLVPNTLTVYRHFKLDPFRGELFPMSYSRSYVTYFRIQGAPVKANHRSYVATQGVHEAECSKWPDEPHHNTPKLDCTCGFYASYDPATDFYPYHEWFAPWTGDTEMTGAGYVVVKAAVEMSGRVVMGRLGVRAQKMKIAGLCVDWEKRHRARENDPVVPDSWIIDRVKAAAYAYGAKLYGNREAMVEAHGVADVEALGVDTTPRPDDPVEILRQQFQAYAQVATQQINAANQAFIDFQKALLSTLPDARVYIDTRNISFHAEQAKAKRPPKLPPKPLPPSVQAAIDRKRSRPAPPGTGIDRRKRKL
jgi:hypothetical protein